MKAVRIIGFLVMAFLATALLGCSDTLTGLTIAENNNVNFNWNGSWSYNQSFVRVSQGIDVYDTHISEVIYENTITIDLENYNLTNGVVYIDLVVNEEVVDSELVDYYLSPLNETTPPQNQTSNETSPTPVPENDTIVDSGNLTGETIETTKIELESTTGKTALVLLNSNISVLQQELYYEVSEIIGVQSTNQPTTDILAMEVGSNISATIYLPKRGNVNVIKKCDTWKYPK